MFKCVSKCVWKRERKKSDRDKKSSLKNWSAIVNCTAILNMIFDITFFALKNWLNWIIFRCKFWLGAKGLNMNAEYWYRRLALTCNFSKILWAPFCNFVKEFLLNFGNPAKYKLINASKHRCVQASSPKPKPTLI